MWKPTNTTATIVQSSLLVILCIGVVLIALFTRGVYEASLRNLAFVELSQFLLQRTLTLNESVTGAQDLFDQAAALNPSRYEPYQRRLNGWLESLESSSSDGEALLPTVMVSSNYTGEALEIADRLHAIAHGTGEIRQQAIQQLSAYWDQRSDADLGEAAVYTDMGSGSALFPVAFNRCSEFELMALYLSEQRVATRQPVPVVLVWRTTDMGAEELTEATGQFSPQFSWAVGGEGRYLYQVGTVTNRLFDGGFEQTILPREGPPRSLPRPLYSRQTLAHTQLLYEFPESGQNMVLHLDGQGATLVGLRSEPIEIPADLPPQAYLVSGRYRTVGEEPPRIGIRWLLKDAQTWDDNVSSYVVRQGTSEWTPFAGIQLPHSDANALEYWVLNADANSQLYVDNLAILPIPLPCEPTSDVQ